jgi:hypothetical protein
MKSALFYITFNILILSILWTGEHFNEKGFASIIIGVYYSIVIFTDVFFLIYCNTNPKVKESGLKYLDSLKIYMLFGDMAVTYLTFRFGYPELGITMILEILLNFMMKFSQSYC